MTAYVLAQISIHDRPTYNRYAAAFGPVLAQYQGRLLAADEAPEVLEGDWSRQKVILIAFDTADAARLWVNSPEYQAIAVDRLAATDGEALLVKGI